MPDNTPVSDPGNAATDQALDDLEKKIKAVYRRAYNEMMETITEFTKKHKEKNEKKLAQLAAGKITQEDYNKWLAGQVFQSNLWKQKKEQLLNVVNSANEKSVALVNAEAKDVFLTNANYQGFAVEQDLGAAISFTIYDSNTMAKLLREEPELLPQKSLDESKDKAWNNKKVISAVQQGILQGRTIPQIAESLVGKLTEENSAAAMRTARTAMTGAENAGRIEGMRQLESKGVYIQKQWLAANDGRVRETHRELNGQITDVDKPFKIGTKEIKYPADPTASPELVYNCRCTLKHVFPKYSTPNADAYVLDENGQKQPVTKSTFAEWVKKKNSVAKTNIIQGKGDLLSDVVPVDIEHYSAEALEEMVNAVKDKMNAMMQSGDFIGMQKMYQDNSELFSQYEKKKKEEEEKNKRKGGHLTKEDFYSAYSDTFLSKYNYSYEMSNKEAIRSALASWTGNDWADMKHDDFLQSVVDNNAKVFNGTLFRGMSLDKSIVERLTPGTVFAQDGLASWSSDMVSALEFAYSNQTPVLVIDRSNGQQAVSIKDFSGRPFENEVLSSGKNTFEVISKEEQEMEYTDRNGYSHKRKVVVIEVKSEGRNKA